MPILLMVINNVNFLYSHRLPVALAAADAGYDVHVATCFDDIESLRHTDQLTYHYIPFNRQATNPLADLESGYELYRLYKKLKPDLIHHVGMKPILYGSLVARLFTMIPYINAVSGLGYLFTHDSFRTQCVRWIVLMGFRLGCRSKRCYFIFQNNDDADLFKKKNLLKNKNVTYIRGSGVDLTRFFPNPQEKQKILVIFPSRLLWDKGVGQFVNAARMLKASAVTFALVGDVDPFNPMSVPLEDIQNWVHEGIVEYWGWRHDMEHVFQQADIVCLPSYYREGVPKALLDAAASACPIVTTDAPGCRDVVEEGVNGFLVPIKNVELLAERLSCLIESTQLRKQMGQASRKRAEQLFDIKKVVAQHLSLYRDALN